MQFGETKTSFKIGGLVGIIILLLGIAVLFGVYQMSKVGQEVVAISEEYVPLKEILTDIRYHQANQALNFEKIQKFYQIDNHDALEKAKEEFWSSGGRVDSDILAGKKIAQAGFEMATSEKVESGFQEIYSKISEIGRIHENYETLTSDIFFGLETGSQNSQDLLVEQIREEEFLLQNELGQTLNALTLLTDESTSNIVTNEIDSLIGQIIIITFVGVIAASLGFFISQINKDLKKEVDVKTEELRQANEKLTKLDKMKDEFISIASHELKSPLQPIFGFAELAKSGDIDQKEAWDGVIELANKLQDLANAILDVSRIESNRLKLHLEKVRINDLILEILKSIKINLPKEIIIQQNLDEDIEIEVDKVRIAQVFRNLLSNAIKFTPKGAIILETQVNRGDNMIKVKVSDSGVGIPKEILPKIFGKFVTQNQNQENKSGTGLGLFLCKGIVEAHGGKISAYNNKHGGATFEFSLPITNKLKDQKAPEIFTN